jgi:hypothetical protein
VLRLGWCAAATLCCTPSLMLMLMLMLIADVGAGAARGWK